MQLKAECLIRPEAILLGDGALGIQSGADTSSCLLWILINLSNSTKKCASHMTKVYIEFFLEHSCEFRYFHLSSKFLDMNIIKYILYAL